MATTIVSSPGKVLLAGGYLVLDPAYSGIVVSTSSRFYTVIRDSVGETRGPNPNLYRIRVRSPQFLDAVWTYSVELDASVARVQQVTDDPKSSTTKNKFVHLAIQRTLTLALAVQGLAAVNDVLSKNLDVVIVGDNDFYSQRAQLQSLGLDPIFSSLSQLPAFSKTNVQLSEVHKTGLGSSAALITSLVSALLIHTSVIPRAALSQEQDVMTSTERQLIHNLSQYIHCYAQGKVGSGFDVAAAVFGSQVYTRFNPPVLQPLMTDDLPAPSQLLAIISPSNTSWDYRVEPFGLPPLTRLMLADVDAGSDTPSLVGKVLKWRQADVTTAHALWEALNRSNHLLHISLTRLSDMHAQDPAAYTAALKYISTLQPLQWLANPNTSPGQQKFIEAFYSVHQFSQDIRGKMREMGTLSGVPIEPPEQTRLLDVCVSQAGVIGGGVPGAGGYDAIWLLVCDPAQLPSVEAPLHRVERVWTTWKDLVVTPLSANESTAKGVRLIESTDEIPGLKEALEE